MIIAEILKANGKFPTLLVNPAKVLVTVFSQELLEKSIAVAQELRTEKINCDLYLNSEDKLAKQIKYADNKKIPYVLIIGPDEIKNKTFTLKSLKNGVQKSVFESELFKILRLN